nr:MAG TPA: hypothetical protein [Caudoviricetes sp.]
MWKRWTGGRKHDKRPLDKSGGRGIVKKQQVNVVSIIDSFLKHRPRLFQQPGPFVS